MHETQETTERLWQLVQGTKDAEMESHLQTCSDCREEYESLQALFALRSSGGFAPVPEELLRNLNELMQKVRPDLVPAASPRPGIVERLQTIVAELMHDTAVQPQLVGLRGNSGTRQIAFVSDVADLDLEVSPADEQFLVVGQLGMDSIPDNLHIRFVPADVDPITEASETMRSTDVSDQGYFRLTIEPGDWVVAVDVNEAVVVFPGLKL